jgi:ferritin-like protein
VIVIRKEMCEEIRKEMREEMRRHFSSLFIIRKIKNLDIHKTYAI